MEIEHAVDRVLLGEPLESIAAAHREELLRDSGLDPRQAGPGVLQAETRGFMKKLCRQLGERHAGDRRALVGLRDWLRGAEDYEAYDALLTHFDFEGKETLIRRGRILFAGPMTAHWKA